jgi:4-amino-4-deoxy-L-arabinose transferase-like glycosyltransferase
MMNKAGKHYSILMAVCALSLALRIGIIFVRGTYLCDYSQTDHGSMAANVASGVGYTFMGLPSSYFGPVYTYLWACCLSIHRSAGQLALQLLQAVMLSVAPLFLYSFSRFYFDRQTSLVGAIWLAMYPELLILSSTMFPCAVLVFLWCASLACYAVLRRKQGGSVPWALLMGLVMSLLVLTKGRMFPFVALLLASLAFPFNGSSLKIHGSFFPRFRAAAIAGLVVAAGVAPWSIRNYLVHGRFLLVESSFGYNLWIGNNPEATGTGKWKAGASGYDPSFSSGNGGGFPVPGDVQAELAKCNSEVAKDDVFKKHAERFIKENAGDVVKLGGKKIFYAWVLDTTNSYALQPLYWLPWLATLVLFVVGLIWRVIVEHRWDWLLWAILFVSTALQVVFFVIPRLRYPTYPIVFLFAACATVQILRRVLPRRIHLEMSPT